MLGLDLDLLNLSAPDVIEKFRKEIENEVKQPVTTFTLYHEAGKNEIAIKTPSHKKVIKGRMISFLIRKILKMKFKIAVTFQTIELVYTPGETFIVMRTDKGIETQTL